MKEEQVMSLAEISKKYPDNWLAVKVLERDENAQPVRVKLIKKNQDLYNIRSGINEEDVCIFFTGSIPLTRVVLML